MLRDVPWNLSAEAAEAKEACLALLRSGQADEAPRHAVALSCVVVQSANCDE